MVVSQNVDLSYRLLVRYINLQLGMLFSHAKNNNDRSVINRYRTGVLTDLTYAIY